MIADARQLPRDAQLDCDLCIVGGGPAGITIAHELRDSGLKIILLESGGQKETAEEMDLNKGFAVPPQSHEPLEENRRRTFGGSTSAWGGRCVAFDEIDFLPRPWVPHSGWPFGIEEINPYYPRALELCEAGPYACRVEEALPGVAREMIAGFDGEEIVSNLLERWGPPTHFGRRYAPPLRAARDIQVLLHANCMGLHLTADGRQLDRIASASEPGRNFTIRAKRCVLACGALENARLMLASTGVARTGIGNHSDALGRYYMSHLFGTVAHVRVHDLRPDRFFYEFERDAGGVYLRRRFWVRAAAQEAHRMMNAVGFFFRPMLGSSLHHGGLFSATHLAKLTLQAVSRHGLLGGLRRLAGNRRELAAHLLTVLRDAPTLAPEVASIVRQRYFSRRRLPFVIPPRRTNDFSLFYQTEHAPNPDSRVRLGAERDRFGMPRLEIEVRFSEIDRHTVLEFHRLLQARFTAAGVGTMHLDESELLGWMEERFRRFNSSAHQVGTTRMSADPGLGVVDADCRVHSVENLYVAGGSVFPTCSHANPTLTMVALAVRLARHLGKP